MKSIFALLLVFSVASIATADEPLFANADFETGTLESWTADGNAFEFQPTQGNNTVARKREPSHHQGQFWIGTYEKHNGTDDQPGATQGDGPTGTLTSPDFTIKQPFITYRIGGGNLPGKTGVKLVCGDQEIELSSGVDSETMVQRSSDVSKFVGQTARLVIFDNATDGWGHINVDDFRGTLEAVVDKSAEFFFTGGISAAAYPETDYLQPERPQFHFSSKKNWLNDPNGMCWDGEKFHLFFQHNPQGTAWGNMTWGHATSPDMVHWKQLDHALLPYKIDGHEGTIFSGTAVVDHNNSLGKQNGDVETLVAFFTFATKPNFYQAMAYSTDRGATWTYWNEGRAVVPNQGFDSGERDPKVFWHAPSKQWVMALWVEKKPGRVRWFTSKNLTDWEFASDLMRDWAYECMDVVFLPVDGNLANTKCLIYDASFDYEVGTFDGKQFKSEIEVQKAGGGNFYAAQTFNNSPDGRAIQIGWMQGGPNTGETLKSPHNQQMSFPCEMKLVNGPDGIRLNYWPIREIESLIDRVRSFENIELADGDDLFKDVDNLDLVDLEVDVDPGSAKQIVIEFPGVTLTYNAERKTLVQTGVEKDGKARDFTVFKDFSARDGSLRFRLLVDRLSVESYAFAGEDFRAIYYSPRNGSGNQSFRAVGGTAKVNRVSVRRLRSAWQSTENADWPPAAE